MKLTFNQSKVIVITGLILINIFFIAEENPFISLLILLLFLGVSLILTPKDLQYIKGKHYLYILILNIIGLLLLTYFVIIRFIENY